MFRLRYSGWMERVATSSALTAAILAAPGWAKIGLASRNEHMRERAAQELAEGVLDRLQSDFAQEAHPDQIPLAL